jgi:hypothetical protein
MIQTRRAMSSRTIGTWPSLNYIRRRRLRWPSPEKSIGECYQPFNSNRCWEAIGPAKEASIQIFKGIKDVLESRNDYLNEGEQVPPQIMFGMYIIGRSETESQPTILFSSRSKKARRKAMKLIKESSILTEFPGVLLAHSSQPPQDPTPPRPLASGSYGGSPLGFNDAGTVYTFGDVVHACGTPIMVRQPDGSARKATMGGILHLQKWYYGLTVAHVFSETLEEFDKSPEGHIDFAFDDDDDDEECIEMAGRGSYPKILRRYLTTKSR